MATKTTYTAYSEHVLDHIRECHHCGNSFLVKIRAFGVAQESITTYFYRFRASYEAAADRAEESAQQNVAAMVLANRHNVIPHRCTHCGWFSETDKELMYSTYEQYRDQALGKVWKIPIALFFIAGIALFFQLAATGYIAHLRAGHIPFALTDLTPFVLPFVPGLLWLARNWCKYRPISEPEYKHAIDHTNDPEYAQKWLDYWNRFRDRIYRLYDGTELSDHAAASLKLVAIIRATSPPQLFDALWPH